jgi:hypothetical protein
MNSDVETLFNKLWERLNLRSGLTFDEYTKIRNYIKNTETLQMIDNMILGTKRYNPFEVFQGIYREKSRIFSEIENTKHTGGTQMPKFDVVIHLEYEVEADSPEDAKQQILMSDILSDDIEHSIKVKR